MNYGKLPNVFGKFVKLYYNEDFRTTCDWKFAKAVKSKLQNRRKTWIQGSLKFQGQKISPSLILM